MPVPPASGCHHDHQVQFYDDEKRLNEAVSSFLHEGFSAGQPLVVIATQKRRLAVSRALKARGVDVREAGRSGQLAWRDARQTLDHFMVERRPDPDLFSEHVGGLVAFARARTPASILRAYGEMVDVLLADGNPEAALQLEDMWNELSERYSFSLLCAYNMANFSRESDAPLLTAVCDRHSKVLPYHVYVDEKNVEARARAIVLLQQRAKALETEVEQRKVLERALRRTLALRRQAEQERERLLAETEEARSQAEHANRIKDEFLAVVSHELRTPLNAIRGWAEIIALGKSDASTLQHGLDVIQRNAEVQHQLVEELLDVSRIAAGKLSLHTEVVDLADVVHIAIDTVRPSADAKTIALEVDAEIGCLVKGDAVRLQQVVGNLLNNAVKFSRIGGRIQVSLKPVNAQAAFVVQDEGVGIAPEFLPYVFDRFRQADGVSARTHGGLGLGLTVVKHLVTAHDGSITAQSKGAGQGATFAIALPLQPSMTMTLEQLPTTVG